MPDPAAYQAGKMPPPSQGTPKADVKAAHRAFVQGLKDSGFDYPDKMGMHAVEPIGFNPSKSDKQRKFMGAELARSRVGKKTKTGMSEKQLKEFAHKPKGGYK